MKYKKIKAHPPFAFTFLEPEGSARSLDGVICSVLLSALGKSAGGCLDNGGCATPSILSDYLDFKS